MNFEFLSKFELCRCQKVSKNPVAQKTKGSLTSDGNFSLLKNELNETLFVYVQHEKTFSMQQFYFGRGAPHHCAPKSSSRQCENKASPDFSPKIADLHAKTAKIKLSNLLTTWCFPCQNKTKISSNQNKKINKTVNFTNFYQRLFLE